MKIVADENIPHVAESFEELGEVITCPGRSMNADTVHDADVLLVRSVTQVDSSLLEGSTVKYVGTATSGLNHIDQKYLLQSDIGFGHAQGANANSVAEYVIAAVIEATSTREKPVHEYTCGIVGYGHVGTKVYTQLKALGLNCIAYDPPLAESTKDFFATWQDILNCDIITFHTPLTHDMQYPTHHIVNHEFLDTIKPDTILINAARGEIMDTQALLHAKKKHPDLYYIFDVWENEPTINLDLLQQTEIATPHIAGYSWDAKIAGTRQIFDGVCKHYQLNIPWHPPTAPDSPINLATPPKNTNTLQSRLRYAYPIQEDDQRLRKALTQNTNTPGTAFDTLRKNYWTRREFKHFNINIEDSSKK